jgi:short subunit dehydrogenase-like uncharacterized protein
MNLRAQDSRAGERKVAVFGATGHTGRFVVSELLTRGMAPIAVARDGAKLAELALAAPGVTVREAAIEDAASLDRAFAGAAAVVNCAGPFLETAEAVASAALRGGAHYLDVTAEQPSTLATYAAFEGPARDAGVVVIPAMGFYGGFADLLVTAAMGDWGSADDIRIGIALDSWHPTQGTRITGQKNTAQRMVVTGGRLEPLPQPAAEMDWDFPEPFAQQRVVELPFSEIAVIARHIRTSELHTYLSHTALRDIRNPTTPPPAPADASGRSAQTFMVEAVVRKGGQTRRIVAQGRDIYAFSAPLICEAVERLLDGGTPVSGVQAPGAIFEAREFLNALAPQHLTFEMAGE